MRFIHRWGALALAMLLPLLGVGHAEAARPTSTRLLSSAISTHRIDIGDGWTLRISKSRDAFDNYEVALLFEPRDGTPGDRYWRWASGGRYSFDWREPWHAKLALRHTIPGRGLLAFELYWTGKSVPRPDVEVETTYSIKPVVVTGHLSRPARVTGGLTIDGRAIKVDVGGLMNVKTPFY